MNNSTKANNQMYLAVAMMCAVLGMSLILSSCESGGSGGGSSGGSTVAGNVNTFSSASAFYAPQKPAHGLAKIIAEISEFVVPSALAAVANVHVQVQGTDLAGTTASDGSFIISGVPSGDQTLVFSFDTATAFLSVNVPANATVTLNDINVNGDSGSVHVGNTDVVVHEDDNSNSNDNEVENENENNNGNDNGHDDDNGNGNDNGHDDDNGNSNDNDD